MYREVYKHGLQGQRAIYRDANYADGYTATLSDRSRMVLPTSVYFDFVILMDIRPSAQYK